MPVGNMNTPLSADQQAFLQAGQQKVQANMAKTGTFNGATPSQNLANVYNSGVDPNKPVIPTPYISGVLSQAAKDTASQTPMPQTNYSTPTAVPTPVAASNSTPAPQGSFPGQLTAAQIQAEAQARIDKQRAAITGATNAANAARKNVFDYTNQITGDSRTLENGAFNETHNPFTGQTGYAQANLQRNRGIQDTANNNNYQADITANNQKLTDFETLAPEQQQTILNDLTRQERDYGLQVGALTGQLNGQNTMQQNQNNFNNGIAQGNLTGNYTGPTGNQGQGTMSAQSIAPSTGGNNMGWQGQSQASDMNQFNANQSAWATASPQQQQLLHQQNTDIANKYGGQYNSQTGQWNFPQNSNTGINGGYDPGFSMSGNQTNDVGFGMKSNFAGDNGFSQSRGVRTLAAQNQDFNQSTNNRDFAYQQSRDLIKDKEYQQTFDYNVKKDGLDYAIKQATLANQITNDQAQRAIGYMNANTSQQQANTSAANSAANISNLTADNQRQQSEFEQKQKDTVYQKSFDNLKSLYTAKDPYTGEIKVTNPQQLRAAILAKNLSDDVTIQMLSDFGLPIKQ